MKRMPFNILTAILCGLFFSIYLLPGYMPNAYSQDSAAEDIGHSSPPKKISSGAYVIEDISYDPLTQDYTYEYTLKNLGKNLVWWWGIWYEEDPQAILDDSQADENGFAPTDLTDCSPGWKSTAPQRRMGFFLYNGPSGEMGFYSTYASDFRSGNSPIIPSTIDLPLVGGQWGWNGAGANILTAYGIQHGQEGYYVIRSKKYLPGNKTFFYNTKDYWNSYYDNQAGQLIIRGFEFVATTQRSYSISTSLTQGYNLIAQPFAELISPDYSPASYQASTLLSTIPGCQKVIRFDPLSQKTESYLSWNGSPVGTDFPINPGEGYYAEIAADTTFDLTGLLATEPQTLDLNQGYNFISFIYGPNMPDDLRTGYTSSSLLSAMPGCNAIIRFNPTSQKTESYRSWAGYPIGREFDIRVGEGYMVEVLTDTSWTPDKLSLSSMRLRQANEPLYYSLTSPAISAPDISNLRESYQTAGSVIISWITDIDSTGEVHYSTSSDLAGYKVSRDNDAGKVHWVELSGLQPGQTCYYEVQSGTTVNNNGGYYYAYVPLHTSSPLDNFFIGGRALVSDDSPLADALVFVTINHQGVDSFPLSTCTTKDGVWLFNLADLKNSATGDSLPSSPDDPVLLMIDGGNGWQEDGSNIVVSDLTEDKDYILVISSTPAAALPPPVLSPSSGTFSNSISVSITCAAQGAVIRYTKDGSEPTATSPAYTAPLILNETTTIKAKAFKSGYAPSNTVSEIYTKIRPKAAAPVLSPSSGNFPGSISISITCATQGAIIRYTKDGSEPTAYSLTYTAPLTLTKTTTLKAKAFKSGYTSSDTMSETYTKLEKAASPSILPVSRTFSGSITLSITCMAQGASIRYTTDGSEPTENSPIYSAPLTLTSTTVVKAKAFKSGFIPSDTVSGTYTRLVEQVATPILSLPSGIFLDSVSVSITCSTQGASIRYTTDGGEPTDTSPIYAASLILTSTTTIKAKAFKDGYTPSATARCTYTREVATVAQPVLSPSPCTFTDSVSVSITCSTQGASIHYTTDGSEPTDYSPIYTASLALSNTTTIKAKAFKSEYTPSVAVSGTYTKMAASKPQANQLPGYSGNPVLWNQPWSYSSITMDYQPWSSTSSIWSYQQPWSSTSSLDYQSWLFNTSSWNYQPWSYNF